MSAAGRSAFYAFPPNAYGYCGEKSFCNSLKSYLSWNPGTKKLEAELKKFQGHYSYLKLIAEENGLNPFDKEVVEAFWIGNSLLENVRSSAIKKFLCEDLFKKGSGRARKLAAGLPDGILVHHSFNALYVNFVTDKVEKTIKNYDSCCVTFGDIKKVNKNSADVLRYSIGWKNGFCLERINDRIDLERRGMRFLKDLQEGDLISVHWGMGIEKLNEAEFKRLKNYTQKNIKAVSSHS